MSVAVLIPTIEERAQLAGEVVGAYHNQGADWVYTIKDRTCGGGWNELARIASDHEPDYLFFTSDDMVPEPGCLQAAVERMGAGVVPVPQCFTVTGDPCSPAFDGRADGEPSDWARLFYLTPALYEQTGRFLDINWYIDFDYSSRLLEHAPMQACAEFRFTHMDAPRTWQQPGVVGREWAIYRGACLRAGRVPAA